MKYLNLILLFAFSLPLFSQISDDKEKLKQNAIEISNLKLRNNSLIADSIKKSNLILHLKFQMSQVQYTVDSLRWAHKKCFIVKDSLNSITKQIVVLSKGGVLLYQLDKGDDVYYIDLRYYDITIQENGNIKLLPIKGDKPKDKLRVDEYPYDNLSLHFYPHRFDGTKIKF